MSIVERLTALLGADRVLTGEAALPYCRDWRNRYAGTALAVVFPADTHQVSAVVKLCAAESVSLIPQGGNTSLCGAGVPLAESATPQLVLNLSRLNRIRAVDALNDTLTVEAGCKLADIYTAAEQVNRLFPLGLTAIAPHCEIGGNLSTNAGGIGVLRYGTARELVLGLEVVLPDGRVWDGLRGLRKDNTGYDLKQLFLGAEGTLGVITAAVLKLFPRPQSQATACIAVRDPAAALALLAHVRSGCGTQLSAFELISRSCLDLVFQHIPDTAEPFAARYDWQILLQLSDGQALPLRDYLYQTLKRFTGGALEFVVSDEPAQAERWWKLRKNISAAQKAEGISIKHDIAVPISRVAELIAEADAALRAEFPSLRIVTFGHLGDGNLHYNVSLPGADNAAFIAGSEARVNEMVYRIVARLGGTISAEHGLGQLKRQEIRHYKSPLELELMQRLKQALDPQGLMNPGKVI